MASDSPRSAAWMAVDFRVLQHFVVVAEELHFTRAAERLHIAQPALSEQIKRLETTVGVELLRRTTRSVALTSAGEAFLARARKILQEADAAQAEAERTRRGETGCIRVATGATAGVGLVAEILHALRAGRPQLNVELRHMDWENYFGGLGDGSVDAAFVWLPVAHPDLSFMPLHSEPRVAVLAATHPLAQQAPIGLDQLLSEPWPWADTNSAALAYWTCEDLRGGPARRGPRVRSMEGMLEAVRANLCVATVPRSQADASSWPGIAFRAVAGLTPATLALAWRTAAESPAVIALAAAARRAAPY